jgi:hypothetical protein
MRKMSKIDYEPFLLKIVSSIMMRGIVLLAPICLSYFFSLSLESRLILINTGLILFFISYTIYIRLSREQSKLIRPFDRPHVYLIEGKNARHIPDGETLNYFAQLKGTDRPDIEVVKPEEFKKEFIVGSALPSILPHCEKYHKKLCEEELRKKAQPNS